MTADVIRLYRAPGETSRHPTTIYSIDVVRWADGTVSVMATPPITSARDGHELAHILSRAAVLIEQPERRG